MTCVLLPNDLYTKTDLLHVHLNVVFYCENRNIQEKNSSLPHRNVLKKPD